MIIRTGPIRCEVDDRRRVVVFTLVRGIPPLTDGAVRALMNWALQRTGQYERKGYMLDLTALPEWMLENGAAKV